jgi:hypothetical protein
LVSGQWSVVSGQLFSGQLVSGLLAGQIGQLVSWSVVRCSVVSWSTVVQLTSCSFELAVGQLDCC